MIKLAIFDFDGVFTNGNIYYSSNNRQTKYYNVKDGMAITLLKSNSIFSGLISSHKSSATKYIAKHLKFNKTSIGSPTPKLDILRKWQNEYNIKNYEIAYIGDDIVDISCLEYVGLSACPNDAVSNVINICNYICKNKGGEGAVREFVEHVIHLNTASQAPS